MPNFRILSIVVLSLPMLSIPAAAGECESLEHVALPHTTLTAQMVAPGKFTTAYGDAIEGLPAFCRVAGVIQPTTDSYIRFEVWLPSAGWNNKYLGVGNGGFAGEIDFNQMADVLKRGYATAATDTGHEGDSVDASWAYRHPEKVADFGYRGLHLTTENAKTLVKAFYSHPLEHSYFDSCSDGGREALVEVERFPEDFDGVLAGAPAYFWTHLVASGVPRARILRNPAAYISDIKVPAISAAVNAACDAQDGVKDGIINDPRDCHFDPAVLLCKGPETRNCLTAPQVEYLKSLYAGAAGFPGLMPGAEGGSGGWGTWVLGSAPGDGLGYAFVQNYFRYVVFDDPAWNPFTADAGAALRAADEKTARTLNATDADLSRFQARGGKLILYHGWNDPAIPALSTVRYYESVVSKMGPENTASLVRLYMVPGMQHCIGGPGATFLGQFGTLTEQGGAYGALERWVEAGTAPGRIVATKWAGRPSKVVMTRPLCPYPEVAKYQESGDSNAASSFVCTARK